MVKAAKFLILCKLKVFTIGGTIETNIVIDITVLYNSVYTVITLTRTVEIVGLSVHSRQ